MTWTRIGSGEIGSTGVAYYRNTEAGHTDEWVRLPATDTAVGTNPPERLSSVSSEADPSTGRIIYRRHHAASGDLPPVAGARDAFTSEGVTIAPGHPNPHATTGVTGASSVGPEGSPNEQRLRQTLDGLLHDRSSVDAFMSRFSTGRNRDREISAWLPGTTEHNDSVRGRTLGADAGAVRRQIAEDLRDRGVRAYEQAHVSPRVAYDNLVARGILFGGDRPSETATWADLRSSWRANPGSRWMINPEMPVSASRSATSDPLFTGSSSALSDTSVVADTQRRNYIEEARARYVSWATSPAADGGLGLTTEAATTRFNERAEELHMMRRRDDGSYEIRTGPGEWDPTGPDMNSPAQSFFHREDSEGHTLPLVYNEDGSLQITGDHAATFRSENPSAVSGTAPTDPVTAATRRTVARELARDTLFTSLTGELPEGSRMRIEHEGEGAERRTFLVNPAETDPARRRIEVRVVEPPLTRTQALAYMQSRHLTDADGQPLTDASPASFLSEVRGIRTGEVGGSEIQYRVATWERQEIARVLSGPPHSMTAQQITRYMNSHGWLGDHPNLDQMEAFRTRAAGIRSAGSEATTLHGEVEAANVEGNDPTEVTERDRAASITDALSSGHGSRRDEGAREGRAGRESSEREGRASRNTTIRVEEMRQAGEDRRARENREAQRFQQQRELDARANESRLGREHDTAQRERDRQNQMMMSLIQFLGQMINGALQAMGTVHQGSMQQMAAATQNYGQIRSRPG